MNGGPVLNYEPEMFDPAGVNKPIKPKNKKVKKVLIYLLCVVIGIAFAAGAIYSYKVIFTGSSSPEEAVAEYTRASLKYDVDGMIRQSSQYNKVVLYGNRETSDRLLRTYLEKAYAEQPESQYKDSEVKFELISVVEYESGEPKFEEYIEKYSEKADREEVDKLAIVKMTVNDGSSSKTRTYLTVKCGMRWYYAYAGV